MARVILNRAPRLVRKFAEVDFERVRRRAQHVNVRAGAKNARLETCDYNCAHLRIFEANSLNRVGEFDIYTQVIRVQFQPVTIRERHVFLHVH